MVKPRARSLSFSAGAVGAALLSAMTISGCGPEKPATVSFRMTSNVRDALVTVDDQLLGTVAYVEKRGVALKPGQHRLTVEKPGYFPYDELVEAKDVMVQIQVKLEPIPD